MDKHFKLLKVKKYDIIGSYKNPNKKFFTDIDLVETLGQYLDAWKFVKEIQKIINSIKKTKNIYFLDFKAGSYEGLPIKWTMDEILRGYKYSGNRRIDLESVFYQDATIKLDTLILDDYKMVPVTINYILKYQTQKDNENILGDIYTHARNYKEKGNMIEYIKKMEVFYRIKRDKKKEKNMLDFLNSDLGLIYKYVQHLDALLQLLKSDNEGYTLDTIKNNLSKIEKKIPNEVRHFVVPLSNIHTKEMLINTIPKAKKYLVEYVNKNIILK